MSKLNYFKNRPKVMKINVDAYLGRIRETREEASLTYLRKLHRAHLLHIPFENLDIHYNRKIILDYQSIFEKIVIQKRGGYCYELNGLFYHLLHHLGFECKIISARVLDEDSGELGKEFDHMAIIVTISEEDYLVDVGFGKGIMYPKKIADGVVQMDYTDYWKVTSEPDDNFLLQVSSDASAFRTKFRFSCDAKEIIQFHEMNEYHQSQPESSFTQKKIITKLTTTGRITLSNSRFQELDLGDKKVNEIGSEDEFLSLLEQHFGITFQQLMPKST